MLSRSQRLSVEQFNSVMKKGRANHSPFFILIQEPQDSGHTRVSATVPTKIAKKAVERNRSRKLMYEAIKTVYPMISKPNHIVVIAKAALLKADLPTITKEIRDIFVKAGLLM